MPDLQEFSPEVNLALKPPPATSARSSREPSASRRSSSSSRPATTSSPTAAPHQLPAADGRTVRPPAPQRARPVEGKADDGVPIVLFLCVHNAGPLADGARAGSTTSPATGPSPGRAAPNRRARSTPPPCRRWPRSASTSPSEYPKPWTDEIVQAADVVVTMGCGDACPIFPGKRYEDWELDDPAGQGVDAVRPDPRRDRQARQTPARPAHHQPRGRSLTHRGRGRSHRSGAGCR